MARFQYNGEYQSHGGILILQGPCKQIKLPQKDGTIQIINASDPINGFIIGDDIGVTITDPRSIRCLQADVRFTQLS